MREALAKHMFDRRCRLDSADPALVELAWIDQNIQDFWLAEADSVLGFIGLDDLSARLSNSVAVLQALVRHDYWSQVDQFRLYGKIEGVKLAISYLEEKIRHG